MQGKLVNFKTNSQCAKVLAYLQSGKSLTCLEAIQLGLTHNLKSRISDLKKSGYNIKSEKVNITGGYIARYSFKKDEK